MLPRKLIALGPLVAAVLVLTAAPAFAHIGVEPTKVASGSDVELTFHVPNETESAATNKIEMQMPTDTPFGEVSVSAPAGWTVATTTVKLDNPITTDDGTVTEAIDTVTWSGGSIPPGNYADFSIFVGPVPQDVTSLSFPTVQSYDDGTSVSWVETPTEGGAEPEHPAPTVEVAAAPSGGGGGSSSTKTLAEVAAVIAVVALLLAGYAVFSAWRRHRPRDLV
jgi:uncharacterized protein YcnI